MSVRYLRDRAASREAAMMEAERSLDDVDRLACQFMRKCKVTSSTESESDNNNEGSSRTPNHGTAKKKRSTKMEGSSRTPNHGTAKKKRSTKMEVLDPYDGDSEDNSTDSDSSLHSSRTHVQGSVDYQSCHGGELLPDHKHSHGSVRNIQVHDVCMRLDGGATRSHEKLWGSSTGPSGIISETNTTHSGHFLQIGVHLRNAHSVSLGNMSSEENGNVCMFHSSAAKRKMGPQTDFTVDELRRKKARVMECME